MARQGDGKWFVAGVNAEESEKLLELDLGNLCGASKSGQLITDGGESGFDRKSVKLRPDGKVSIKLPSHGGFVLVLD